MAVYCACIRSPAFAQLLVCESRTWAVLVCQGGPGHCGKCPPLIIIIITIMIITIMIILTMIMMIITIMIIILISIVITTKGGRRPLKPVPRGDLKGGPKAWGARE